MDIFSIISSIDYNSIVSEEDVRSKIAIPIISCLGYPDDVRAEDFPIYGYEGRKPLHAKSADIIYFSSSDIASHTTRKTRDWVTNHSLIVVELKKPSEDLFDAQGQASFYSMWSRSPYYICTNGKKISIHQLENNTGDIELFACDVADLPTYWLDIYSKLSFEKVSQNKIPISLSEENSNYKDYCLSKIQNFRISNTWNWEQTVSLENSTEKISPLNLIPNDENILLLSGAGSGKTTCLNNLLIFYAENYLNEKIPILLSAKFWKRSFHSIYEGILNELNPFIPYLSIDLVKNECSNGKYVLFIDGLDECLENRDMLIQEIINFKNNKCFVSCRKDRYYDELCDFQKYQLNLLEDSEIVAYSTEIFEKNTFMTIHSMEKGLKSLLHMPLYLNMWLSYCTKHVNSPIPVNLSILYNDFISQLLGKYLVKKGNYDFTKIPPDTIKDVLSEYAFITFDTNKRTDIYTIINKYFPYGTYDEVFTIIFQSGLLYESNGVIDFQQFTLKEYFYARYIALSHEKISYFLDKYHRNDKYYEITELLLGIIEDNSEQNYALDYLEMHNLPLFIKCLRKRYNFSNQYVDNITQEVCTKFFTRILKTYENIINFHFSAFKESFIPWRMVQDKERHHIESKIKGSIDPDTLSVNIELLPFMDKTSDKIEIDYLGSNPTMNFVKDGRKISAPILSLSNNNGQYFFDINTLYSGIDCAREVAIDIIKKDLQQIFANNLLIMREPAYMQLCYLEDIFRNISPLNVKKGDELYEYDLSFSHNSMPELEQIFFGIQNIRTRIRRQYVSFFEIYRLLKINIETNINIQEIPFPKWDIKPLEGGGFVWDYYSTDSIISWLKIHYREFQNTYREFLETFFPTLLIDIPMYYQGPFQYQLMVVMPPKEQRGIGNGGSLFETIIPQASINECEPRIKVVQNNEEFHRGEFDTRRKNYQKQLKFYGRRPSNSYSEKTSGLFFYFTKDNSVRTEVYKQIEKDLSKIFGK